MPNPHFCPICGKGKGGTSHAACSKILQVQHAGRRRPAPKKLASNHINYLSKTPEAI